MHWYTIFSHDVIASSRGIKQRALKSPVMTLWFIGLYVTLVWAILKIMDFYIRGELESDLTITPANILMMLFFFFMAKSIVETLHNTFQNRSMVFLLAQPFPPVTIYIAKVIRAIVYNLELLALGGAAFVSVFLLSDMRANIPPLFMPNLIIVVMLASVIGTIFAAASSLSTIKRKLMAVLLISPLMTVLRLITDLDIASRWMMPALLTVLAVSLVYIPFASKFLLEGWLQRTSTRSVKKIVRRSNLTGFNFLDKEARWLMRKEFKEAMGQREFHGTVLTVVSVGAALLYLRNELGDVLLAGAYSKYSGLVYPIITGMGLFLALVLSCGIYALSSIGREGYKFWLIKNMPVKPESVIQAKAFNVLMTVPLTIAVVGLPIPMITGMSPLLWLFAILAGTAMAFLFTAIGIWGSTRYANFDESVKGMPDIISMYNIMMLCLFSTLLITGIPVAIMTIDTLLGFLAMIFSLDMTALALHTAIRRGGKRLELMEMA